MDLKGTKTEQNLLAAFSGESMARNKYLFYAEQAEKEGHPELSDLFQRMAKNEGMHGKLLFQKLSGVKDSASNLQEAIKGEFGEWSSMYPEFAKTAREEGFEDVADLFDNIAKIEQNHELTFMQALVDLTKAGQNASAQPAQKQTVLTEGYRCVFCGAIFDHRPDVCSVCHAIGSFERTQYQKTV